MSRKSDFDIIADMGVKESRKSPRKSPKRCAECGSHDHLVKIRKNLMEDNGKKIVAEKFLCPICRKHHSD